MEMFVIVKYSKTKIFGSKCNKARAQMNFNTKYNKKF